jgi:hypothetical protein
MRMNIITFSEFKKFIKSFLIGHVKNFIQALEARIDELLFQEPTTKISDPNSKYYGSIDQNASNDLISVGDFKIKF